MSHKLRAAFDGASSKIERANRHINELKSVFESLATNQPNGLALRIDADGAQILDFHALGPEAAQIPLILGDAVHNMRGALDHIWMALFRQIKTNGYEYFPFHETWKNLKDTVSKSLVKRAFPDVERLILQEIKPCGEAGGDNFFWAITKLDKIDKHNLLIPTARVSWVEHIVIGSGSRSVEIRDCAFQGITGLVRSKSPLKYENHGKVAFEIVFPKDNVLPNEPVLPALVYMSEAARKAVQLFRDTFI